MTVTFLRMSLSDSFPLLILLSFINGVVWGFYPILHVVPFHIEGINPREGSIAIALVMTIMSLGMAIGPMITGLVQEAPGSLKYPL